MSLFRAGSVPKGVSVAHPVWQTLQPLRIVGGSQGQPSFAQNLPSAAPTGTLLEQRDAILQQARMQAADILQQAAGEVEAAVAAARQEAFLAGRQEGAAAATAEVEAQRQAARFALEKAELQADTVRQAAEADARAIRAEAEAERQRLLSQARAEAAKLLADARAERDRFLEESRDAVVDLAVTAASRLVQGHLALEPSAVVAMVAAGLRRMRDADCTVRISPQDLPLLTAQRSQLERELGSGTLQLQADAGLTPGSHLIQSQQGSIDATLEAQSVRLREAMAAALGRG